MPGIQKVLTYKINSIHQRYCARFWLGFQFIFKQEESKHLTAQEKIFEPANAVGPY